MPVFPRYAEAEWVPWRASDDTGRAAYYRSVMSPARPPDGAVLHIMEGHMSTARAWAASGHYGASWHFSVGRDGHVMQHLALEDGGYHAGVSSRQAAWKPPVWKHWRGAEFNVNHYCVTPEIPILTPQLKWVPAGDLRVGDPLLGFDEYPVGEGRRRRMKDAEVAHTGIRKQPVYRVVLGNGDELYSTAEHRWLVRGIQSSTTGVQWITTADLAATLKHPLRRKPPLMPRYFPVTGPLDSYASGFLAAAFDGEGSLSKHIGGRTFFLAYHQLPNAMRDAVQRYLSGLGYRWSEFQHTSSTSENEVMQTVLRGGRESVYRFLMEMRPPRLIDRWLMMDRDDFALSSREHVPVLAVEYAGEREIVELGSTTLTYIANGYGAHNTIGIEHEGFVTQRGFTAAQADASIRLCRWLADLFGWEWSRDRFPPHADIDRVNRVNDFGYPEVREAHYRRMFALAQQEEDGMTEAETRTLVREMLAEALTPVEARLERLNGAMVERMRLHRLADDPDFAAVETLAAHLRAAGYEV